MAMRSVSNCNSTIKTVPPSVCYKLADLFRKFTSSLFDGAKLVLCDVSGEEVQALQCNASYDLDKKFQLLVRKSRDKRSSY